MGTQVLSTALLPWFNTDGAGQIAKSHFLPGRHLSTYFPSRCLSFQRACMWSRLGFPKEPDRAGWHIPHCLPSAASSSETKFPASL